MCGGIEKIGCDVIVKSEMEKLIKTENLLKVMQRRGIFRGGEKK